MAVDGIFTVLKSWKPIPCILLSQIMYIGVTKDIFDLLCKYNNSAFVYMVML